MEALSNNLIRQNALAATNILLIHTVGALAQIAVALLLVWTLVKLRREGQLPRGFLAVAVLISLLSLVRAVRLTWTWFAPLAPLWLNGLTIALLFFTMLVIPIVLSTHYRAGAALERSKIISRIQWMMTLNALLGIASCCVAARKGELYLIPLLGCVVLVISVSLLLGLASITQNLQIRRRGLALFASLTCAGQIVVSANLFLGYVALDHRLPHIDLAAALVWSSASREGAMALIALGMVFIFANLRLSDVLIKQALKIYIWCVMPLCGWTAVTEVYSRFENRILHDAFLSLWALAFLAALTIYTQALVRKSDEWVDRWVLQVPSFASAIQDFATRLRSINEAQRAYNIGEEVIHETLLIASVQMAPPAAIPWPSRQLLMNAEPFFPDSSLRSSLIFKPDVVMPLLQDGVIQRWIALSQGVMRPPLTSGELGFVSKMAMLLQDRIEAIMGEEVRLERQRREASLREEIQDAELRALRAQINPHFLFNSLNTIADLSIVEPRKAEEMTLRLAAVFRYVLVNGDQQFTTVSEELEFMRSYLDIEEARFEERLKVEFSVEAAALERKIPTLLLQPLVENAIKHGISPRMQGGTVKISAKQISGGFQIIVADDGVGLSPRYKQDASKPGAHIGLSNTERRLRVAYGDQASFTLRACPSGGTEAEITILAKEKNESTTC